jgi:hypothetical protein
MHFANPFEGFVITNEAQKRSRMTYPSLYYNSSFYWRADASHRHTSVNSIVYCPPHTVMKQL